MKTYLFSILATLLVAVGCTVDEPTPNEPEPKPDPTPEVVITLNESEITLQKGEEFQLSATLSEGSGEISWESDNKKVAIVDRTGKVIALTVGEATITARSAEAEAHCLVSVVEKPKVGWYYYDDGSYSSKLDHEKRAIGVIFWVGDPTAHDELLKREHPNCTNGLVVALNDDDVSHHWQPNYEQYGASVGEWIEANRPEFRSITSPWNEDETVNAMRGYNNTKAIEAFNAAEENAAWPVTAMNALNDHRRTVAAPESSSGWYFPSIKELNLAFSGDYQGPITDFENEDTTVKDTINSALMKVPGSKSYNNDYLSSTELDALNVYDMMVWALYIPTEGISKTAGISFRAVLAF